MPRYELRQIVDNDDLIRPRNLTNRLFHNVINRDQVACLNIQATSYSNIAILSVFRVWVSDLGGGGVVGEGRHCMIITSRTSKSGYNPTTYTCFRHNRTLKLLISAINKKYVRFLLWFQVFFRYSLIAALLSLYKKILLALFWDKDFTHPSFVWVFRVPARPAYDILLLFSEK